MSIRDFVFSCFMAGFIAVLGVFPPISLFFCPTPITLQSLGVMLAGCLLGAKRGGVALLLFLGLLAIGLPVLSMLGGVGLFFTPYGGFFLAWPLAAFIIGWLTEKFWQKMNFMRMVMINFIGGFLVIYCAGVPWMSFFANISLLKAFYLSLTLLPGDFIKIFLASWAGMAFKKYYPLIELSSKNLNKIGAESTV